MAYTIVHVAEDNGEVNAYGRFAKLDRAQVALANMNADLDLCALCLAWIDQALGKRLHLFAICDRLASVRT